MVVFACGACGDSVKRNQVLKHCERCRGCEMLSCIDCGKDFWGNDYEQHIKCVSEEEKYSGKNYVPKPNANKNEVKQMEWLEKVQAASDKYTKQDLVKSVLEKLKDYTNVPRSQKKFENFLKNSVGVRDRTTPSILWNLLMVDTNKGSSGQSQTAATGTDKSALDSKGDNSSNKPSAGNTENEQSETQSKTLNKRERKEERRKKSHKAEKKEKHMNGTAEDDSGDTKKKEKKKRKRKHESDDEEDQDIASENIQPNEESIVEEEEQEPQRKRFKTSFNWEKTIQSVLESKGTEVKIKKLRKKVLAEYLAQGCTEKSEEKLWAKFDKKLKKNPCFKVLNDRVKLVS